MTGIKMNYPDVLAAARRAVSAPDSDGWWRSWELPDLLARQLGISRAYQNGREHAAVRRFDSQCLRAFNELTAEGTLRKAGRGERTPGGQLMGNTEAQFYTPAAWADAEAEQIEVVQVRALTRAAWEHVYDRLSDAGLAPLSERGKPVELALPVWTALLGKLD